jgi:hypothetical protein
MKTILKTVFADTGFVDTRDGLEATQDCRHSNEVRSVPKIASLPRPGTGTAQMPNMVAPGQFRLPQRGPGRIYVNCSAAGQGAQQAVFIGYSAGIMPGHRQQG